MKYSLAVAALVATAAAAETPAAKCDIKSFAVYKDDKCTELKAKATPEQ